MPSINVLSKELSELIAAGEVIERPASVIKELVENSIDSGATHITIEIKNGGTTYMRVTDDGCGMSFEDVPKAFLRHATSKVSSKDDLNNINTLGFRGEALASVSAVSRVEVMTKQNGEDYGTLYSITGSEEQSHEKGGCPNGTTIVIRDLFYNVPARQKFLKKDVTEANAVSQIVQKITLSHPEISFKLIRDNRMEFNSIGNGDLYSAIRAIYGKDFANDMIVADYEYEKIKVSGYIIRPLYAKKNRSFQNFFVNGRYIKSFLCSSAVENAYENMIMTGKFPCCVLMIDMSPSAMDVNIHPSKAEIRFSDEKKVTDAIFFAVKNALISNGLLYELNVKPPENYLKNTQEEDPYVQASLFTPVDKIDEVENEIKKQEISSRNDKSLETAKNQSLFNTFSNQLVEKIEEIKNKSSNKDFSTSVNEKVENSVNIPVDNEFSTPVNENVENFVEFEDNEYETVGIQTFNGFNTEVKQEKTPSEEQMDGFKYISQQSFNAPIQEQPPKPQKVTSPLEEEFPNIKVIGEAFGLYVIAESGNKIIMIDKHAAHERIIFERLKSRNCRQYSQKLLTGIKVLLTSEEIDVLENNTDLLLDLGFEFDFSERPCITVTAVPTFAMELEIDSIITEVADNLLMHKNNPQSETFDDILHHVACKSAIKANDKNSLSELQALVEQVCYDERIRHCPHGRPVMFTMTKNNIDHQFKRT